MKLWEIWKYSLGSFSDDRTKPYDNYVAGVRTVLFLSVLCTNIFIVSGVLRHWNGSTNQVVISNDHPHRHGFSCDGVDPLEQYPSTAGR